MREREERKSGTVRDTNLTGETRVNKFTTVKVPRQYPFVLLVKVGRKERKPFENGEGREMKSGNACL
jgi:hypothetical protein